MYFNIDSVTICQDGSKTALPKETYKQSNTFLERYRELLFDDMYEGVYDEEVGERRNYHFGYEIYDDSQSKKVNSSIYLSEHDYNCLSKQFPLNFGFDL